MKKGKGKGKGKGEGKSCTTGTGNHDRDGELKLNWIGEYGDYYSNGFVALNQNGEPFIVPNYKIGPFEANSASITEGLPGTNSYYTTFGNDLVFGHKPLLQEFDGMLTG